MSASLVYGTSFTRTVPGLAHGMSGVQSEKFSEMACWTPKTAQNSLIAGSAVTVTVAPPVIVPPTYCQLLKAYCVLVFNPTCSGFKLRTCFDPAGHTAELGTR